MYLNREFPRNKNKISSNNPSNIQCLLNLLFLFTNTMRFNSMDDTIASHISIDRPSLSVNILTIIPSIRVQKI